MNAAAALYQFWSSFDLPAYESNSVPTGEAAPKMPYLTYDVVVGTFSADTALFASLWYEDGDGVSALLDGTNKADEICKKIGRSGARIYCDNGAIWLRLGQPKYQVIGDPTKDTVKQITMNFTASFLTSV